MARTALGGLMLAVSAQENRADEVIVNQFNTASEVVPWHFDYGSAGITNALAFSTNDAKGSAASAP